VPSTARHRILEDAVTSYSGQWAWQGLVRTPVLVRTGNGCSSTRSPQCVRDYR